MLDTRWFHTTGIITAVGEHTATEVAAALRAAKKNGATTSYDLNFRSTLWSREDAQKAMVEIMPYVDVVIGNEEDFETMLGIKADNTDQNFSKLDPESYRGVAQKVMEKYPNVICVGTSLRRGHLRMPEQLADRDDDAQRLLRLPQVRQYRDL